MLAKPPGRGSCGRWPQFAAGGQGVHHHSALTLGAADCPSPHVIIGGGKICREIDDYGVAWKNDARVRRGKEVRYWGVLDAANYNLVAHKSRITPRAKQMQVASSA